MPENDKVKNKWQYFLILNSLLLKKVEFLDIRYREVKKKNKKLVKFLSRLKI